MSGYRSATSRGVSGYAPHVANVSRPPFAGKGYPVGGGVIHRETSHPAAPSKPRYRKRPARTPPSSIPWDPHFKCRKKPPRWRGAPSPLRPAGVVVVWSKPCEVTPFLLTDVAPRLAFAISYAPGKVGGHALSHNRYRIPHGVCGHPTFLNPGGAWLNATASLEAVMIEHTGIFHGPSSWCRVVGLNAEVERSRHPGQRASGWRAISRHAGKNPNILVGGSNQRMDGWMAGIGRILWRL